MLPCCTLPGIFTETTGEHSVMPYPSHSTPCGQHAAKAAYTCSGHFSAPTKAKRTLAKSVVPFAFFSMASKKVGVAPKRVSRKSRTRKTKGAASVGLGWQATAILPARGSTSPTISPKEWKGGSMESTRSRSFLIRLIISIALSLSSIEIFAVT